MAISQKSKKELIEENKALLSRLKELEHSETEGKNAQDELRRSKEFLDNVINALDDSFFVKDHEHRWLMLNDTACKLMGRPREELIGRSDYDIFPKEQASVFWEKDNVVFETGKTNVNEEQVTWHGKIHTISTKKSLYTDPVTSKKFITGTVRDITERKKAEEALKQSEIKYRSLVANIPDVVWTSGEKGNTTFISENIREIYGYSPKEIYNQGDKLWFGRIHPDDIEKVAQSFKAVFEKGKPLDLEYRVKRKDGQWIWIRDRSIGAYEKDGVKYADGVFTDITERKKAQEAVRYERDIAQKYLDVARVIFVVLDTNGQVRLVNKKGCEVLGYKEEEIIGKSWFDNFLPERMRDDVALVFNKLVAGEIEPVEYYENPVMTKSGEERIIAWHNTILRDSLGNMTGFLSSGEDITERRQAEDKLRQSEERFKMLFESAPDAYYIHDLDGHFIDGNKAGEQLIGYSKEEVIGDNFVNLDLVAEEDIPKVLAAMAENKDGKPAGPLELTVYRKDGSKVIVETRSYPVEIDGQTVVLGIARDITERKKAEVVLRQSEQRLKILFEYAPDAIYLSDLKGNIIDGNKTAEKMLRYAEDELIGKNLLDVGLLSSEHLLRAIASLEKNAMGKPTGPDEFTLIRKDGSSVPVEIRTFPVRIGDQVLSLGIARDISARKKDEQKLFEHRAQLKSLASELSLTEERERHRLATDLHDHISQALVFSRIKLQELHASVSSAEIAGPLGEACDNLDRIIQDTRTLTFDLSFPILYELGFEAAVSEWLDEQIGQKHGIKTQFEDDGLPKALEDDIRVLLFRNVRELLINIVKHADAQNVKVSIRRISEKICVTVEDDGVGFNPVDMASNAGFGIFSVRERLEQLAGHIEIESEPGRGSKITMTAPLKCDEISRDDKIKT